jgi:hypothetical protein
MWLSRKGLFPESIGYLNKLYGERGFDGNNAGGGVGENIDGMVF